MADTPTVAEAVSDVVEAVEADATAAAQDAVEAANEAREEAEEAAELLAEAAMEAARMQRIEALENEVRSWRESHATEMSSLRAMMETVQNELTTLRQPVPVVTPEPLPVSPTPEAPVVMQETVTTTTASLESAEDARPAAETKPRRIRVL